MANAKSDGTIGSAHTHLQHLGCLTVSQIFSCSSTTSPCRPLRPTSPTPRFGALTRVAPSYLSPGSAGTQSRIRAHNTLPGLELCLAHRHSAVDIVEFKGKKALPLVLSQKWLSFAGASEPLVLKNVYVQNQLIPVTEQAQVRAVEETDTDRR